MNKKTKHRKSKVRGCDSSPHRKFISWKTARLSEAKKPLVITVVALAALLLLSLLVLFAPKFVGKAFYSEHTGSMGIADPGVISPNTPFTITVKAHIGTAKTVALSFQLALPSGLTCTQVQSLLGWDQANGAVLNQAACDNSQVIFEYATIDADLSKTGAFDIAAITFNGVPAGSYTLDFTSSEVINLDTNEPISLIVLDADIVVPETACTPGATQGCSTGHPGVCSAGFQACQAGVWGVCLQRTLSSAEICDDRLDNDCDGATDCTDNNCAADPACALEPTGLPSVEGAKIILEELPATQVGNVVTFNTKLTAKENLTPFKTISQLEDAAIPGVVLLYKTETIGMMTAGEARTVQTSYRLPEGVTQIKKKTLVYDRLPGDSLQCSKLEYTYTTP